MRKTKIVCTLGPATDDENVLRQLMLEGMSVARMNFSHGSHEEQKKRLDMVKKLRKELGLPVAALLDTKGPEIRIGDIEGGKVELKKGQTFVLTTEDIVGNAEIVSITYKQLYKDVKPGDSILIDDGLIGMEVQKIDGEEIVCQVKNGGFISNHKGVNVPGVELKMPFVSQKDYEISCLRLSRIMILLLLPSQERQMIFWRSVRFWKKKADSTFILLRRLKICREWRTVRRFSAWQTVS